MMSTDPIAGKREMDCENCPPDRVCAWACEQGMGVLEVLMGEALAEQARLWPVEPEVEAVQEALHEIYT
jgi:hypothetical protein